MRSIWQTYILNATSDSLYFSKGTIIKTPSSNVTIIVNGSSIPLTGLGYVVPDNGVYQFVFPPSFPCLYINGDFSLLSSLNAFYVSALQLSETGTDINYDIVLAGGSNVKYTQSDKFMLSLKIPYTTALSRRLMLLVRIPDYIKGLNISLYSGLAVDVTIMSSETYAEVNASAQNFVNSVNMRLMWLASAQSLILRLSKSSNTAGLILLTESFIS